MNSVRPHLRIAVLFLLVIGPGSCTGTLEDTDNLVVKALEDNGNVVVANSASPGAFLQWKSTNDYKCITCLEESASKPKTSKPYANCRNEANCKPNTCTEFFNCAWAEYPPKKTCYGSGDSQCIRGGENRPGCNDCCQNNAGGDYSLPKYIKAAAGNDVNLLKLWEDYGVLGNFKRTCKDFEKAGDCSESCSLYNKITESVCQPKPFDKYTGCHTIQHLQTSTPCTLWRATESRYLVVPGNHKTPWGVSGIDYFMNQDPDYEMILTVAWSAAYNPYYMIYGQNNPIPANAYVYPDLPPDPKRKRAANIGIALNSGSTRSVHQMHIHIAYIPKRVRQFFQGTNAADKFLNWRKIRMPTGTLTDTVKHPAAIAYAKYFKVDYVAKGWPGPHKLNVFQQIYNFANQQHGEMSAWGLLLIPDENPKVIINGKTMPAGYYMVVSTQNTNAEGWNAYYQKLTGSDGKQLQNYRWAPEYFLCTDGSTAIKDGNWATCDDPYAASASADCDCPYVKY